MAADVAAPSLVDLLNLIRADDPTTRHELERKSDLGRAVVSDRLTMLADLGLIGILAILFAETGLLIGLAFPGDSLLFIAGLAASGSAAELLGGEVEDDKIVQLLGQL